MVHQYKNNGYDIVLDVNSGAIHVVDDVTYDVIALYEGHTREEIVNSLRERYPETEVEEALDEVQMLVDNEGAFYEGYLRELYHGFQKAPDGCEGSVPAHCA